MGIRIPSIREIIEAFTVPSDREDLAVRIFRAVNLGDDMVNKLDKRQKVFAQDAEHFALASAIAKSNAKAAGDEIELIHKLQDTLLGAVE